MTNPNNPLGTIYSPEVLKRVVEWARKKGMHTIVDEIYALGTHRVSTEAGSALSTLQAKLRLLL